MIVSNILPAAAVVLVFARSALAGKDYGGECKLTTCLSESSFDDSNSYAEFDHNGEGARLAIIDRDIEIKWRDQDKSHPVRLSWHWWSENDTDPQYEIDGVRQFASIKWDKNITGEDSSTTINFWKIIQEDFPNNYTNLTTWELLGRTQNNHSAMVLSIYQPESPKFKQLQDEWNTEADDPQLLDFTDEFHLSQYNGEYKTTERYFTAQYDRGRRQELEKWRMGVGIGVGIGVPILTAIAVFVGYAFGKKAGPSKSKPVSDTASS